ncbi:nitrite reductase large subunit NirB [Bacillus suaedae]|uniref:Nitrite reductase large subunit NirB n=1 Tax=Halalkalibacter suaedae TaxID=2822140 RepID=A0A940WYU5_9BACI|nr:nitrite reductase large subunit NirB [Bacillus suaedae]MBP3953332.1 nitrite reductase large subunit NirB [Bacillus suaedae]
MGNQKLVIIGNGMAGVRCAEEIIKNDPNAFDIDIIGSEPHGNYNRIMLSAVLQGGTKMDDILINGLDWYEENQITLHAGETVTKINRKKKEVSTDQKKTIAYDRLIIATGSNPFMIPFPGSDKEGVMAFRTMEDCEQMVEAAKNYDKAVVIGGGLLGLEAAKGLLHLGMKVDVVHLGDYLMERQLDCKAAKLLQAELEKQGMNFLLEKQTERFIGQKRVKAIAFKDGTQTRADLVVMAVGVRPNIELAKDCGLEINRAIVVNDFMQTSDPSIYAVGECVEHRGVVYGLVKPLYEQGKVLAKHICDVGTRGYQGTILSTQLKISGVDVFSVGQFVDDATTKSMNVLDELEGIYKKVVFRDKIAIGAVLFGDTREGPKLMEMISNQERADVVKEAIFQVTTKSAEEHLATMPLSETICTCNNVSKGTIIEAVQNQGCATVDDIKKCTKASGSCGGCKPLVTDLLSYIQSDEFDEAIEEKTFCSCTTLTENEVVEQIQVQHLTTIKDVKRELGWQASGCSTCSAALDYYLGIIFADGISSNVADQRVGATKQFDGNYTITPSLSGGMVSAETLKELSNLIDTYKINRVALTQNQRISLIGIKEQDVETILDKLGIEKRASEHWVHNVRTCIGETNCHCDRYSVLELAEQLDELLEYAYTPEHLFLAASGCIHDGANSKQTDIGLIKINRGWEIYISGTLLCVSEGDVSVSDTVIALVQYYRQTANYLESIKQWMDRIGIIHLREVLFEYDLRIELLEGFHKNSQHHLKKLELS